jgi:hypothetical protein
LLTTSPCSDLAAVFVGLLEAGDQAQRRGLAAAGRAEQREELALLDVERDLLDRLKGAEGLAHVVELDDGFGQEALLDARILRKEALSRLYGSRAGEPR